MTAWVLGVVGSVLAAEVYMWLPALAARMVRLAASRLPRKADRYCEEWTAHLNDIPGHGAKFVHAVGLLMGLPRLRRALMPVSQSPFAEMLPRLFELKEAVPDPTHPDAYFQHFEERIESDHVRSLYLRVERALGLLDADAWHDLKERAVPFLTVRDAKRGWQALFDTLNEAKGYAYLRSLGCTEVAFIKRKNKKTPDLRARQHGRPVLCEVKTINLSQDEADRRHRVHQGEIRAFSVPTHVTPQMLEKVRSTLVHAVAQLDHEDRPRTARRIVFTVLNFDDSVCDYQAEYIADIDGHLTANPVTDAELVFCPASNLFADRRFLMQSATVVEI
jgi:hypothetical protein